MYKILNMYVLPASHFNVHVAIELGRAGEQKPFPMLWLLFAASVFLLAVSVFSSWRDVPMSIVVKLNYTNFPDFSQNMLYGP
jgi:hypothetical protein